MLLKMSAIKDKTKEFSTTFKKYRNQLNRVIECFKRLYFNHVVKRNKSNSKKLWKFINNIAATRPTSHSKINGVLDVNGNLVNEPKGIGNAMNKNFVSIADNLIKKRMDFVCDFSEFSLNFGKSEFVFKAISKT